MSQPNIHFDKEDPAVGIALTRNARIGFLLITALVAAACAAAPPTTTYDPAAKDMYHKIFDQVLQKAIGSKTGENICLPPLFGFGDNVIDTVVVNPDLETPLPGLNPAASRAGQLKALEAAGLVVSSETTRTVNNKPQRMLTYRRTPMGLASSQGASICYARGEFDHLVKWKGPIVLGEYQAAYVYYTVKTTHVEDWAKSPEIQAAFPSTVPIVRGDPAKVRQTVIDLSSDGWDIAEYSKLLQLQ
jgi:hypothetical protein